MNIYFVWPAVLEIVTALFILQQCVFVIEKIGCIIVGASLLGIFMVWSFVIYTVFAIFVHIFLPDLSRKKRIALLIVLGILSAIIAFPTISVVHLAGFMSIVSAVQDGIGKIGNLF